MYVDPLNTTLHLVRRSQDGDTAARDELFRRILPRLRHAVALRLGKRVREVVEDEDIVQETLLDAHTQLGAFVPRSDGALMHWLATIAENKIRSRVRREHAQKRDVGRNLQPVHNAEASLSSFLFVSQEPSPSSVAGGRELEELLEEAILALDDRSRRAIDLRGLCGMSYEELAAEFGLADAASARAFYSRVTLKLARQIGLNAS